MPSAPAIAADQQVVAHQRLLAGLDPLDGEIGGILREFVADGAHQQGEVARRRVLLRRMQAVRIDEMRTGSCRAAAPRRSSARRRLLPMPPTFSPTAMAMSLADLTSIIFSALSSVITEPGLKPILLGGSAAACLLTLIGEVSASSPGGHRAERHIGRHQLGERGRMPAPEGVLMRQYPAGAEFEQDSRIGRCRPGDNAAPSDRQPDQQPAEGKSLPHHRFPKWPLAELARQSLRFRDPARPPAPQTQYATFAERATSNIVRGAIYPM